MRTAARIAIAAGLAVVLASGLVAAAEADHVSGTWTVAGTKIELTRVRTFREPDPFGSGTHPCLLASNEPVPDVAVPDDDEGISALLDLMRSGSLRALQICFAADGRSLRNVNDAVTFHPDVSPGRFALQGFHHFAPGAKAGDRIAGRVTGEGTTMMTDLPWSDALEISVALPPAP